MNKPLVLVTGGSRGIGAAVCRALARDGYKILVHYNKTREKAESLATEIGGTALQANLEDDAQIYKLFQIIQEEHGSLSVLVNNAGIAECEPITSVTRASFFRTNQVNLWAPVLCTQLTLPLMPSGSIVFLSSICAQTPTADAIAYAASKAGIEAITRSIAPTLAPNIRVNAVAPGATDTDMMRSNYSNNDLAHAKNTYPMKRICEPNDIAEMVAFLVSDRAKNITGQIFTVDAGATLC